jgi:aromatic ring-opening dioxygenase catalytic subunit (LigB family)
MTGTTKRGDDELTRRAALAAGLAVGTAGLVAGCAADTASSPARDDAAASTGSRLPVVFVPHGGGPWPFVPGLGDPAELDALSAYLRSVRDVPRSPVKALLVVSAHWEERVPTVTTSERPPMLYDYYGFPPASYEVQWPAPGEPQVAARVRELLGGAGFETAADAARGFDHGTFVPLKLTYPDAELPTVQLSLKAGLDPLEHLAMGRALAPLRDEGVFIVGSGMTYHNMRGFRDPRQRPVAAAFDAWLREAATLPAAERDARLAAWASAPSARAVHPREEHLLPLMVIAGAAGGDPGSVPFNGTVFGLPITAVHFG